ncbi:MAG: NAD(P)-dependent oxidoreductase [Candidatus Eremiobacteraeota bacterium]|nr:NAD(P)-dependent oxidoreductase [Candidatus Eremiobacteraeota bacterium]
MKIGIVGSGRMGSNMALHLDDVGWDVEVVYDVDPAAANVLAEQVGAVVPATLADVTDLSETIVTVVSDDDAMYTIFATDGDSLLTNATGKLFVNCATVTPQVHLEVERRCDARGARSLEACMASSIPQARDGSLYLMCGGRQDVFEEAKPLLKALSSSLRYIGSAGKAAQVKALVNMLMNINTAGLAEALGLGDALGLDLSMLREVFSQTGAASRVLVTDGEDMQNREHETFFSAAHAAKDSHIALTLAEGAALELPLARATAQQYDRMIEERLGDLDKSGIAELTFACRHPSRSSKLTRHRSSSPS